MQDFETRLSNGHSDDAASTGRAVKADFTAIRRDLSALRDDLLSLGSAKAGEAGDQLDTQLKRVRETASSLLTKFDSQTKSVSSKVQDNVRDHPMSALGAAAAVGFLLGGVLLSRRR